MSREDIIHFIKTLNSSLDIQFLEGLSRAELNGYLAHLKAVREKTRFEAERTPVNAATK